MKGFLKGFLINILTLGFLLTLYIYINTNNEETLIQENAAQTQELAENFSTDHTTNITINTEDVTYRIVEGDTLSSIGNKFGVSVEKIKEINGLKENQIVIGDYIDIPVRAAIENNQSLDKKDYNSSLDELNDTKTLAQTYEDDTFEFEDSGDGTLDLSDAPTDGNFDLGEVPTDNAQAQNDPEQRKRLERQQEREKRRQMRIQQREEAFQKRANGNNQPKANENENADNKAEKKNDKVIIADGEIVSLQSEMDVQDLIQTISEITGENFILEESVKGKKITVVAPGGFKSENAMRLFETILSLNGFSVVKKNGANIIVPKRDIKFQDIPTEFGTGQSESSDQFITRLVELQNVQASEVANILKPLVSREGDIVVYPATNTLIIIERVDNLNRILKIIENFDVETEIEFIKIENGDAAEVATKLLEIFGSSSSSSGTGSRRATSQRAATLTQQQRRTSRANTRNQATQQNAPAITAQSTQESSPVSFKVITDERTNSLIIIAYPSDMAKIKAVIEILDVKTEEQQDGIFVIRVLNADAEQIVGVLSALFGGGGGGFGGGFAQERAQRTSGFGGSGTFGSTGSSGAGGSSTFGQSQSISRQNTGGRSGSVVAETEDLRITADPATNSIIIVGSRRDYEEVKDVIDELDIRRKQVFVEAAILEVSLDKIRSFGTNLSVGFTINDSTLGFGGTALPGVPSLLGVAANPDAATNLVGSLSGLFLGVVGEEVDPDGSGPIPPIPSFSALFQALTSLTDVNVLSTPSIITTDNEPAEIIVADVIPFPTGSTVGDGGVTVQTIDREPVGIRLSITPQISEGDFLNLNILTEVSALRDAPVAGLNTAQFGIATTTRTADSSVVVKNGQTIVIGGLVQDRESVLQNRVPVLGSIPVLGNLFKFKQRQSTKINLMILLTPRIVENEVDMQRILEERQKRNMLLQERGFNREEPN
jgi:general secretion pathway protein D